MTRERSVPQEDSASVMPARPELGGASATPSFTLPVGAPDGMPAGLGETRIGPRTFRWSERTFVMGIVNVTPDSFSGDGLLSGSNGDGAANGVAAAVRQAREMAADGADLLDIGGESTRPGHAEVGADEEVRRVVPVVRAIHEALPEMPLTVDTTSLITAGSTTGGTAPVAATNGLDGNGKGNGHAARRPSPEARGKAFAPGTTRPSYESPR